MGMHVKAPGLLILALLIMSLVDCKPWFCGEQDCPDFTTKYSKSYDVREYGETKWVGTTIQTSKPYASTKQLRQLFTKIYPYYQGENSQGRTVSLAVPAMNRVLKIRKGVNNVTMMWYLPDNNPPTPTSPDVFLFTRPAGDIYVKEFQTRRWPRESVFVQKYSQLKNSIRDSSKYTPDLFYRVSYNYPFNKKKKQHEVWLDKI